MSLPSRLGQEQPTSTAPSVMSAAVVAQLALMRFFDGRAAMFVAPPLPPLDRHRPAERTP